MKFAKLYGNHHPMIINALAYKTNGRQWIHDNIDKFINIRFSDDLTKYKTIFYNTKDALQLIKKIQEDDIGFTYKDKIKCDSYPHKIQSDSDTQKIYDDSILEFNKNELFSYILELENNPESNIVSTLDELLRNYPVIQRKKGRSFIEKLY